MPVENEKATFAGGCFWCITPAFEDLNGVIRVTAGYTGGRTENASYETVCSGKTGHAEAVEIIFDPARISFEKLLDIFWQQIDPTDAGGQFSDRGDQYRSAIFYHNEAQKAAAERSRAELQQSGRFANPVVTGIVPASVFYPAEEYHQDYHKKNPARYKLYRTCSGRQQQTTKS